MPREGIRKRKKENKIKKNSRSRHKMGSIDDPRSQAEYWRSQAEAYKKSLDELQDQYNEFEADSKDLERELEKQCEQSEKKNRDLLSANEKLTRERDSLREKLDSVQTGYRHQIDRLEGDLGQVTSERDRLSTYIRELEQMNDDLDRAQRNAVCSVEEFEKKLNEAIERNAMLESELDEKDALNTHIQRLREETRDLKQELTVRDTKDRSHSSSAALMSTPTRNGSVGGDFRSPMLRSTTPNKSGIPRSVTIDGAGTPPYPGSKIGFSPSGGTPITPSARISALNIVGDLLRKVGALETKLASCRKYAASTQLDEDGNPPGPQAKQPHLSSPPKSSVAPNSTRIAKPKINR